MAYKSSSEARVKVTASLDAELVKAIDLHLKELKTGSRSQLIEAILRKWHTEQKRQEIESQIEDYYSSLSDEEREEDREWNDVAAESASHSWED
jgi:metal-responsive CopG/Arc/MetJ family transcriptional regulator